MLVIRADCPGWDSHMIAQCVLAYEEDYCLTSEDTSLWSDDHINDFLASNNIGVVEERNDLYVYTLHVYQGLEHIADLCEAY